MVRYYIIYLFVSIATFSIEVWVAQAEVLHGKIVGISDGDTVTLLDQSYQQHKIRLSGIDAPEKKQPFGQVSKKALSDLVFGKEVVADCLKLDKYHRQVCKILVGKLDANLEQIKKGFAWHYKKYESDQPPEDRPIYSEAEKSARAARLGLWADPNRRAPWEFRHGEH